jgi:hypothetical protein
MYSAGVSDGVLAASPVRDQAVGQVWDCVVQRMIYWPDCTQVLTGFFGSVRAMPAHQQCWAYLTCGGVHVHVAQTPVYEFKEVQSNMFVLC